MDCHKIHASADWWTEAESFQYVSRPSELTSDFSCQGHCSDQIQGCTEGEEI